MDNSSLMVLGFQFEPERDSLQKPFFKEDDEINETEQERSSNRVSQAVEEYCKCGKCKLMQTDKECRCWHEEASHYLNSNIRVGSRNFASSKLETFAIDDSRHPDPSHFHNHENCENFKSSPLTEHLRVTASGNEGSIETNIILKCNGLQPLP